MKRNRDSQEMEVTEMFTERRKRRLETKIGSILSLTILLIATLAHTQSSNNYRIRTSVLDEGGGQLSSSNFVMKVATLGQPSPTGICVSSDYRNLGGYIYTVELESGEGCVGRRGDPTGDGNINVLDVLAVANHILGNRILTGDAFCRGDCTGDDRINILDALGIANVIMGIIPECPGGRTCKPEITPEVVAFLESLAAHMGPEDFARFMTLVKETNVPNEFSLAQNHPNPFNPTTDIQYQIPESKTTVHTTLIIYNVLGQKVRTLIDEPKAAGYFTSTWDGRDDVGREASSGVYFYRLEAGDFRVTKRMVLTK